MHPDDRERVCDALESLNEADFSEEAEELRLLSENSDDPGWAGRYVAHGVAARAQLYGYISGRPGAQYRGYVNPPSPEPQQLAVASIIFVWAENQVRQGIATALMRRLVDHLISEGCTYLTLSINGDLSASSHASKDPRLDLTARHKFVTERCQMKIFSQFPIIAGGPLDRLQRRLANHSGSH